MEVERALGTLDATHKVPRNPGLPREELAHAFKVTLLKHLSGKRDWPVLEKAAKSQYTVTILGLATTL